MISPVTAVSRKVGPGQSFRKPQGRVASHSARPAPQEQPSALLEASRGPPPFRPFRRSCILRDLREDARASVLSLTCQRQQGGTQGCSWGLGPLNFTLPLPCVPDGMKRALSRSLAFSAACCVPGARGLIITVKPVGLALRSVGGRMGRRPSDPGMGQHTEDFTRSWRDLG